MADNNRIDLNKDLDELAQSLLKDVKAATDEVKQRHAAIKREEAAEQARSKSNKLMAVIVGTAFVAIVLLAVVFANPGSRNATSTTAVTHQAPAPIRSTTTVKSPVRSATSVSGTRTTTGRMSTGRSSQLVEHPSDDYERPSGDSGM